MAKLALCRRTNWCGGTKELRQCDMTRLATRYGVIVYAMAILLIGGVLLLSLAITDHYHSKLLASFEHGYFTFLYAISCLWMLVILAHSSNEKRKHRYCLSCRVLERGPRCSAGRSMCAQCRVGAVPDPLSDNEPHSNQPEAGGLLDISPRLPERRSHFARFSYLYDHGSPNNGLFARVGLGIFCLGNLIHTSLKVVRNFYNSNCDELISVMDLAMNGVFSFLQYFFLFKRSTIVIRSHRNFAFLGGMHVVITDLCVWLKNIVLETRFGLLHDDPECAFPFNHTNSSLPLEGPTTSIYGHMNTLISFLYPFSIEYSLLSLSLMFVITQTLEEFTDVARDRRKKIKALLQPTSACMFRIDCEGSVKGLFFGMITMIFTIVNLCIFEMCKFSHSSSQWLITLSHSTTLALNISSLVCSIALIPLLRHARSKDEQEDKLSVYLLFLAMAGVYLFCLFTLIPLCYAENRSSSLLALTFGLIVVQVAECTVHGFVAYLLLMTKGTHIKTVPTRSLIAFLIICDLSLWLDENIAATKDVVNPYKVSLYRPIPWTVIKAFAGPLKVFFRFHCAYCLATSWGEIRK